MALYGPPTATATVGANTNVVTITGMDLSLITPGMTINLGARDRKTGDAWIIASVTPSGSNGGTVTTQGNIATAYNSAPFVIDTTGYLGTDASYAAAVGLSILSTLNTLLGVATNLYSGARQLVLDKVNAAAASRIVFAIAGRSWGDIVHRTLAFTPTGGQATSIETLGLRAAPDSTTYTDALLIDLTTGAGDLRAGTVTMVAASTVDLGSAPMKVVTVTGAATINSFGAGRRLERIVRFASNGATLVHNATSLDLPNRANIVTRAGDRLHAVSDAAGNWVVVAYHRAGAILPVGSMTFFAPAPSPQTGAFSALGAVSGRYQMLTEKICFYNVDIPISNNGTGGGFYIAVNLPFKASQAAFVGSGRENSAAGRALQSIIAADGTTMQIFNFDNSYPGGNGYRLIVSVVFEVA